MIQDIYNAIADMEPKALRSYVRDLKNRSESLSLEERLKLHFGLVQMDCLDSAIYQMQMIHKEITTAGISRDFLASHSDLKIRLMATYNIWEDACGNTHVDKVDDCCCGDCEGAGPCCGCGCGFLSLYFCIFACCGQNAGIGFLECFCSNEGGLCYGAESGFCCNCEDGGLCCAPLRCCESCANSGC